MDISNPNVQKTIFWVGCAYLCLNFLVRALTTAHEYDAREVVYLTMFFDSLMIVGLVGMKREMNKATSEGERNNLMEAAFWVALAAGVGLLGIRFLHGEVGWWTGHIMYSIYR